MFGWGFADFCAKVAVNAMEELTALVWGHLLATAVLLVAAAFAWNTTAGSGRTGGTSGLAALVGLGVLQGIIYMLLYRGFGQGDVAPLSPVFASFSGVVAVVSILFLGEHTTPLRTAVLILLFAGVLLLGASDGVPLIRGVGRAAGFRPVALAAVLAAAWTLCWSHVVDGHNTLVCAAVMYAAMTSFFVGVAAIKDVPLRVPPHSGLPLAGIALGEAAAYAGISWGYGAGTSVSIVALLSGAFSLPTIALAAAFLRERLGHRALLGAVLVVACSAALAIQ